MKPKFIYVVSPEDENFDCTSRVIVAHSKEQAQTIGQLEVDDFDGEVCFATKIGTADDDVSLGVID